MMKTITIFQLFIINRVAKLVTVNGSPIFQSKHCQTLNKILRLVPKMVRTVRTRRKISGTIRQSRNPGGNKHTPTKVWDTEIRKQPVGPSVVVVRYHGIRVGGFQAIGLARPSKARRVISSGHCTLARAEVPVRAPRWVSRHFANAPFQLYCKYLRYTWTATSFHQHRLHPAISTHTCKLSTHVRINLLNLHCRQIRVKFILNQAMKEKRHFHIVFRKLAKFTPGIRSKRRRNRMNRNTLQWMDKVFIATLEKANRLLVLGTDGFVLAMTFEENFSKWFSPSLKFGLTENLRETKSSLDSQLLVSNICSNFDLELSR